MKVRIDHLLLGFGAVVLLIGGVWSWRALRIDPEQAELEEGLERLRSKPHQRSTPRFLHQRGSYSGASEQSYERQGWVESQTPQAGDPGDLDRNEAIDTFQAVLDELEAAVDDGRRLSELEQAELYNRATGSFTALSAWTDGSDPNDRALIDDAYARMMSLMRELKLEPPRVDPDHNPLRR
ncbi:MAG TPA: hypothetical protein VK034_23275 [Enhygromyxa sp.]|nr:hypothetical protein [Enhygromyxa sp.]